MVIITILSRGVPGKVRWLDQGPRSTRDQLAFSESWRHKARRCRRHSATGPLPPLPGLVADLVVLPEHRRQGVASVLLERAETYERDAGATELRVGVLSGNVGARSLYLAAGFAPYHEMLTNTLEQSGLGEEVELEVRSDEIVIRAASRPRSGWDEAFRAMAREGDDVLLDPDPIASSWDDEEWSW